MKTSYKIVSACIVFIMLWPFTAEAMGKTSLGLRIIGYGNSHFGDFTTISPANLGDATFIEQLGFLDNTVVLELHDYEALGTKTLDMGLVSDVGGQGIWPEQAYWSGDGTVFVCEGVIYDFLRHSAEPPKEFVTGSRNAGSYTVNGKRHIFYEDVYNFAAFLASRGGKGPNILSK